MVGTPKHPDLLKKKHTSQIILMRSSVPGLSFGCRDG